jgi:hypothetical protein
MVGIAPEKVTGKEGGAGRAGCPDKPLDVASGLLRATAQGHPTKYYFVGTPEAAGGFWARAASGHPAK